MNMYYFLPGNEKTGCAALLGIAHTNGTHERERRQLDILHMRRRRDRVRQRLCICERVYVPDDGYTVHGRHRRDGMRVL